MRQATRDILLTVFCTPNNRHLLTINSVKIMVIIIVRRRRRRRNVIRPTRHFKFQILVCCTEWEYLQQIHVQLWHCWSDHRADRNFTVRLYDLARGRIDSILLPRGGAASATCIVDEVLPYVHRNRRFVRDGSQGRPPRLSHTPELCLHSIIVGWLSVALRPRKP